MAEPMSSSLNSRHLTYWVVSSVHNFVCVCLFVGMCAYGSQRSRVSVFFSFIFETRSLWTWSYVARMKWSVSSRHPSVSTFPVLGLQAYILVLSFESEFVKDKFSPSPGNHFMTKSFPHPMSFFHRNFIMQFLIQSSSKSHERIMCNIYKYI